MVLPAYPPMQRSKNQLAKTKIQRQIRRKTNEADRIRQKILILEKELSDNDSIVANLRMLLSRGASKNIGIFCELQRLLERFRGTKHLVMYSSFCATGIVCLTSCAAQLDFGKPADVIKLGNLTYGSASTWKLDETRRQVTCYTTPVTSLSISLQVCSEIIESDSSRYFNSSTHYTDEYASSAEDQDRKVTKGTMACTSTRSQWSLPFASPMEASSPRSPVGSCLQRSMEVSAMDLGPAASSTLTSGRVPSPRSYRISQPSPRSYRTSHSRRQNKRRDNRFFAKPRLISFDDDFPSAATDDSSNLRAQSRIRSREETESPKCVEVRLADESQGVEDEYFRAIEANDVTRIKSLLDLGIPIECRNAQSNTGLILAAMKGYYDTVNCLLSAGASGHVNLSNDDGFTALQYAAKLGDQEIVCCLLKNRADVDAKNKFHQTPVMLAARNGHSEVTETLLGAGASIERRDRGGRNALMMAARNGRVKVIEVLLKANARVNMVDRRGKTALTLMAEHACPRSIRGMELLLDYGAHARADDDDGLCALTYLGRRVKLGLLPLDSIVRSIAERMKRSMQ